MNSEFNWWLLIVGLVVGAGLVWLVVADSRRREIDVGEAERDGEARWIAETMTDAGRPVEEADVLDVLRLHAAYLAAAPPDQSYDEDADEDEDEALEPPDLVGRRRWMAVPEPPATPESSVNRR